jgi:hypothetical protein
VNRPSKVLRLWLSRACIAVVFLANVQCALAFIVWPKTFAPAYELTGEVGAATIQAIGVLFLMWNVPYAVALWHPVRQRRSLWEAVVMQAIGVVGELILTATLPPGHPVLHAAMLSFIGFDGFGFLLLAAAVWIVVRIIPAQGTITQS